MLLVRLLCSDKTCVYRCLWTAAAGELISNFLCLSQACTKIKPLTGQCKNPVTNDEERFDLWLAFFLKAAKPEASLEYNLPQQINPSTQVLIIHRSDFILSHRERHEVPSVVYRLSRINIFPNFILEENHRP